MAFPVLFWKPVLSNALDVEIHPTTFDVYAIAHSQIDSTISMSTLWHSTDHGRTFARLSLVGFPLRQLRLDPNNSEILYGFDLAKTDLAASKDSE